MSQARRIQRINEAELAAGILKPEQSWHHEYKDQAYIFIGGLNKELTETDILRVFSQYGVPTDILLVRDRYTGDSKGFAYLKYEDQRSTILAVDNLNGAKIANRMIQVDHTFFEPRDDNKEYSENIRKELKKDFLVDPDRSIGIKKTSSVKISKKKKEKKSKLLLIEEFKNIESGTKVTIDDDLADPMAKI